MTNPFRVHGPGGVVVEATGKVIHPGDSEWRLYLDWLATAPGGEAPLLPAADDTPTIEAQKAEAFARVDAATATQRVIGTMDALGHTWRLDAPFLIALAIHNAAPGLPTGFALPDVNHQMVPLTQGDLNQLLRAASAYLFQIEAAQADYIAQIHNSPKPLSVKPGRQS